MSYSAESTRKPSLLRRLSEGISRSHVAALVRIVQGVFSSCTRKDGPMTKTEKNTMENQRFIYLTNKELKEALDYLERKFQRQNNVLERIGLRKVKVSSRPYTQAKRYEGGIEPDMVPSLRRGPLTELVARVRPVRYDDERFGELDRLVQTFMMKRALGNIHSTASSRIVTWERFHMSSKIPDM